MAIMRTSRAPQGDNLSRKERRVIVKNTENISVHRRRAKQLASRCKQLQGIESPESLLATIRVNHTLNFLLVLADFFAQDVEQSYRWMEDSKFRSLMKAAVTANDRLMEAVRRINFVGDDYNAYVERALSMADAVADMAMGIDIDQCILETQNAVKLAYRPAYRREHLRRCADIITEVHSQAGTAANREEINAALENVEAGDMPYAEVYIEALRQAGVPEGWRSKAWKGGDR